MKIRKVEIDGFGKLIDRSFNFSSKLQMIFGLNESGKSTLFSFIEQMLFGFETIKKDNRHFKPKIELQGDYGGRLYLEFPELGKVKIERHGIKGKEKLRKNTQTTIILVDQNREISDEEFQKLLLPLTKKLFNNVYSLKQEQLAEVATVTAEDLQDNLLSIATTGSRELIKKSSQLQKEATALFTKNSISRPINSTLKKIKDLQKSIAEKQKEEASYQGLLQQLAEISEQKEKLNHSIDQDQKKIVILKQQLKSQDLYQNFSYLRNLLQRNKLLSTTELKKVLAVKQEKDLLDSELQRAQQNYQAVLLKEQEENTGVRSFYLKNKAKIEQIMLNESTVHELSTLIKEIERRIAEDNEIIETLKATWNWSESNRPQLIDHQKILSFRENLAKLKFSQEELNNSVVDHHSLLLVKVIIAICLALIDLTLLLFFGVPAMILSTAVIVILAVAGNYFFNKFNRETKLNQLLELDHAIEQEKINLQELVDQANLQAMNSLDDLEQYSSKISLFNETLNQRAELLLDLQKNQQQLADLDSKLDFLKEWINFANLATSDKFKKVHQFIAELNLDSSLEVNSAVLAQQIEEINQRIIPARLAEQEILTKYDLSSEQELTQFIAKQEELKQQNEQLEFYTKQLDEIFDLSQEVNFVEIEANLQDQQALLAEDSKIQQNNIDQEYQLNSQRKLLEEQGLLQDLEQEFGYAKAEFQDLVEKWLALQLENKLLLQLVKSSSDQTLPDLIQVATKIFKSLTLENYQKIEFNEQELRVVKEQHSFRVQDLSTGTRDQLYLSLRLSYLINRTKNFSPILIDDGWLHYDQERKGKLVKVLQRVAKDHQIIIFSSDEEFFNLAEEATEPIQVITL